MKHATSEPAELGGESHTMSREIEPIRRPFRRRKVVFLRKWHVWCHLGISTSVTFEISEYPDSRISEFHGS